MTNLPLDESMLAEARNFNRKLAWVPRLRIRNRYTPMLIQALLRCAQAVEGQKKLRTSGVRAERRMAEADGLRVPVRILRPAGPVRGVVLDIHGGAWAIGNAQMGDELNAALAVACGVAVVSVDYRLAGRTPLQALLDDCLAAARWLLDGGLAEYAGLPVIMTGESAGGHLAAATLLRLKAWPALLRRVEGAVLFYGVYDLTGTASVRQAGADTLVLHGPGMVPAMRLLTPDLSDVERRAPPLSPLHGDLAGLPPALMFAGTLDPLRDDTIEMAKRWRLVADVEVHLLPEAPHGFIHFRTAMSRLVIARSHAWIGQCIDRSQKAAA